MNPLHSNSRRSRKSVVAVLIAAAASFVIPLYGATYTVEETVVGPAWEQGTIYTLSPTGMHVATMHAKGSRFVVTLDGVEGPPFDEIFKTTGELEVRYELSSLRPVFAYKWQGPVAFSPDGKRHAYTARLAKEVVVMLDNNEIHRAPYSPAFPQVTHLFFSPDSRHLFFYARTTDTAQSHVLMKDGKPVTPPFSGNPAPIFSADGRRWALLAVSPGSSGELFLTIDGKDAGYVGLKPEFTPDGRRLVSLGRTNGKPDSLLVDGKPQFSARNIESFVISANGDIAAIAIGDGAGKKQLYLNGKPIANTDGVAGVTFSPDGRRWAAWCFDHPQSWVVVDGKKQQEYPRVQDVAFSADSTRLVYTAVAGTKSFVVVDGVEDSGASGILVKPFFSETGNGYAFAVNESGRMDSHRAVINGERHPMGRSIRNLQLSPDGSRHAYFRSIDALVSRLVVDGEEVGSANAEGSELVFSPDGRHFAAKARPLAGNQGSSLYVDGEYFDSDEAPVDIIMEFTPDSRHLLTTNRDNRRGIGAVQTYRLNGQVVATFGNRGVTWANTGGSHRLREAQPDGSVILVGTQVVDGRQTGPMLRVHAKPSSDASIHTWIATTKSDRERAVAEAEAAKARAEAERLAAAEERQRLKEEATAARAKAREDAAAARAKAREDAAAARAAK